MQLLIDESNTKKWRNQIQNQTTSSIQKLNTLNDVHASRYNTAFLAILDVNFERQEVGEIIELVHIW